MRLKQEFYKLPLTFDAEALKQEVSVFRESDWIAHPTGYAGNSAVPLISVNGGINDKFIGPMQATRHLGKCPYIQQVIASFQSVVSRSRLMRLVGGCEVPEHSDINHHWYNRVRIHVPIVTNPDVRFYCGDKAVYMAAGESWIFDSWKMHKVINASMLARTHLVIDTCGSAYFWDLVDQASPVVGTELADNTPTRFVPFDPRGKVEIKSEQFNASVIMPPAEVDALTLDIIEDLRTAKENDPLRTRQFEQAIHRFRHEWRVLWSLHGPCQSGWGLYQKLIDSTLGSVTPLETLMLGSNCSSASQVLNARVLQSALNPVVAPRFKDDINPAREAPVSPETTSAIAGKHTHKKTRVGRNAPCPCGSGRKYKHCHGRTP